MAPPPITPSPHRFITPTNPNANPTPRTASALRIHQIPPQPPSSQQFASAPRFNFSSTQKPATPATHYSSPLSRRPHLPEKQREDISETSSDHSANEADNNDAPASEFPPQPISKRRRPNPPEAITISSSSSSSPPPTSPLHPTIEPSDLTTAANTSYTPTTHLHPHPRFLLKTPKRDQTPSIPSRPPLILPPRSPSPPAETPAFFSPHRRGEKYIPGGLAATVRDWVVEMSQVAHNQAYARKGGREEEWDFRVKVRGFKAGDAGVGMVLVLGWEEEGKRWMLIGKGRGEGEVGVGCVVGIREPTWEIEVEGENWRVGVEWKILNG